MKEDGLYTEFAYKKFMLLFSPHHSNRWRPQKLRAQQHQLHYTHTFSKLPIEIDETQNSSISLFQNHQELSISLCFNHSALLQEHSAEFGLYVQSPRGWCFFSKYDTGINMCPVLFLPKL